MQHSLFPSFGVLASDFSSGSSRFARQLMGAPVGFAMGGPAGGGGAEQGGWTGDHQFSISALYFTLDNYIIPQVARQYAGQGWTDDQIRKEAVHRVGEFSKVNLQYSMAEMDREPVMEVKWEVIKRDGEKQLFASDYGITLRELWEHTREFAEKTGKQSAYNPSEERAQLAMEKRIISGEISTDVFALSHPDGVRYVQMWEKTEGGKIVSKQLDIGAITGRDLTKTEGKDLIHLIKTKYSDRDITPEDLEHPHVMLKNGFVEVEDITTLARAQVMFPAEVVETFTFAARQAAGELVDTIKLVGEYFQTETEEVIQNPEVVKDIDIRELFEDEEKIKPLLTIDKKLEDSLSESEIVQLWKKKAQEALEITPEQSEKLLLEVQETWTMMKDAQEVISFVNDTGVGIAAAFYAIDVMTLSGIKEEIVDRSQFEQVKEEMFTIAFVADTELLIGAGVFALNELAMGQVIDGTTFTEAIELTEEEKKEAFSLKKIPESVDAVVLKETVEFVQGIAEFPVEEQQKAIEKEKEMVEEKIVQIWEVIMSEKTAVTTIHAPSEFIDLEPKEKDVEQFSFAFAVWAILKLINYRAALGSLVAKPSLIAWIQKGKPEGLIQKEVGLWILFSIIWYLAMIREQGAQNNQVPQAQKKKKRKEVVIYAYAS